MESTFHIKKETTVDKSRQSVNNIKWIVDETIWRAAGPHLYVKENVYEKQNL